MTKALWILFIAGQLLSAGNMNHQQEAGYYELNYPIYGRHPSKERVCITKAAETLAIYGATRIFKEYEKEILIGANTVCWGFIVYDRTIGINCKFCF